MFPQGSKSIPSGPPQSPQLCLGKSTLIERTFGPGTMHCRTRHTSCLEFGFQGLAFDSNPCATCSGRHFKERTLLKQMRARQPSRLAPLGKNRLGNPQKQNGLSQHRSGLCTGLTTLGLVDLLRLCLTRHWQQGCAEQFGLSRVSPKSPKWLDFMQNPIRGFVTLSGEQLPLRRLSHEIQRASAI